VRAVASRVCFFVLVVLFDQLFDQRGRNVKRIGMGIVGAGFVGPHHVDAVRRLGYVDVVAVAGSSQASAEKKAEALGARKAYGSYEALLNDPDVQVVHNATPNYLHYPVNAAAIAKGKHVVSDKPLAMTAAEAKKLLDQATKAGIVHAVTFNYRGNPLVQQARNAIARGDIGKPNFLIGQYLQDWLLKDTDYSWRLEPDKGGASSALGDIGSHWCDLAQHVSGLRITHVLGDITTVIPKRKKPVGSREAFAAADANQKVEEVDIKVEDLASVLLRFDNGAKGAFSVGQVCAGHKNDLEIEICGSKASLKWRQEHQNELLIGHRDKPNEILQKDPSLIDREAGRYAHLPGGHQEAWADAFANVMRDIYGFIADGRKASDPHPPAFATFEDGYRANCIVEAILQSASKGSTWIKVDY
jgi:predicted dehydrogenase